MKDLNIDRAPHDFHCKKWRRRHIESYLLWPDAIASVTGQDVNDVVTKLADEFGFAISSTFPNADAPMALMDVRGKEVLAALKADARQVAECIPFDKIPEDVKTLFDEMQTIDVADADDSSAVVSEKGSEVTTAKVADEQLQTGIGREVRTCEFNTQTPFDTGCVLGFSKPHCQWPFVVAGNRFFAPLLNHDARPFFITNRWTPTRVPCSLSR